MLRKFVNIVNPFRLTTLRSRFNSDTNSNDTASPYSQKKVGKTEALSNLIKKSIPDIEFISVEDISGGCGDMFEVVVESNHFKGLSKVKQHQLVTQSLKDEISKMHGIRIHTSVPNTTDFK